MGVARGDGRVVVCACRIEFKARTGISDLNWAWYLPMFSLSHWSSIAKPPELSTNQARQAAVRPGRGAWCGGRYAQMPTAPDAALDRGYQVGSYFILLYVNLRRFICQWCDAPELIGEAGRLSTGSRIFNTGIFREI